MSNVKFIHLRRRNIEDGSISNSGGVTVAFREVGANIEYAIARCSPYDNFSKKLGRIKAEGRLESDKYRKSVHTDFNDFIKTETISQLIAW